MSQNGFLSLLICMLGCSIFWVAVILAILMFNNFY